MLISARKAQYRPVLERDSRMESEKGTTAVPFSTKALFRLISLTAMYNVAPTGGYR